MKILRLFLRDNSYKKSSSFLKMVKRDFDCFDKILPAKIYYRFFEFLYLHKAQSNDNTNQKEKSRQQHNT